MLICSGWDRVTEWLAIATPICSILLLYFIYIFFTSFFHLHLHIVFVYRLSPWRPWLCLLFLLLYLHDPGHFLVCSRYSGPICWMKWLINNCLLLIDIFSIEVSGEAERMLLWSSSCKTGSVLLGTDSVSWAEDAGVSPTFSMSSSGMSVDLSEPWVLNLCKGDNNATLTGLQRPNIYVLLLSGL